MFASNSQSWICRHIHLVTILVPLFLSVNFAFATDTSYVPQSFMFDWTPQGQTPPVPTTAQCETLHIAWERQGTEPGPNPVAPYFLHVFTSAFIVPFVIPAGSGLTYDWPVPFIPGTQYQICMFDSANNTGGCQDIYTVYPAPTSSVIDPPTCRNLSYPHPDQVLGVTASTSTGGFSQYGWIDQCTDISVQPRNGTPPYTLTIAPTLRPPYIITSDTMDPMNWTVALSWGSSFFISLTDSTGMLWSAGPLHSGSGTNTECLDASDTAITESPKIKAWMIGVASASSAVLGVLLGMLGALLFVRCRARPAQSVQPNKQPTPQGQFAGEGDTLPSFDLVTPASSVLAEVSSSTGLCASTSGWPISPTDDRPRDTASAPLAPQRRRASREASYDVLDICATPYGDLPPRYTSPFDPRFKLAAAPQGPRGRSLRPLPIIPTP